ncbi:hypothetical protein [Rhodobacter maris]|uniref:Uncharacterized protein n=1 Tax=Rhodobacter maris TaxID=446682 RepID=A0A285TEQ2_9RHOB|nr:hypothetical protein [Rhodobacter maris]SOC20417.1 hypothetical protein SAMN05877831_11933 [Rhodobacter maris]
MPNILWLLVSLGLAGLFFRWRSPLVVLAPVLFTSSLTSPFFEEGAISINLIMLSWMVCFIVLAVYFKGRRIRIDNFDEVRANYARMTQRAAILLVVALALLLLVISFWIQQAGVEQFSSAKRTTDNGVWFNVSNTIFNLFRQYMVIVLALFRFRLRNPHVLMALLVLIASVLVGYLSSSRGLFIFPLVLVFFVRMVRMRSSNQRLKILTTFFVIGMIGTALMAAISAERAGVGSLAEGFTILGEQLNNSATGYGLAPEKDRIVWDYSQGGGIPVVQVLLLGGFYGLIPRAFWPGKPEFVGTGPLAGAYVFRGQNYVDQGAGIPISFPSEIALAFGSAWFLPGFLATVLVVILVAEILRPFPLLTFALLSFLSGIVAHGLPKSQVELIVNALTLLLITRIVGFRFVQRKS